MPTVPPKLRHSVYNRPACGSDTKKADCLSVSPPHPITLLYSPLSPLLAIFPALRSIVLFKVVFVVCLHCYNRPARDPRTKNETFFFCVATISKSVVNAAPKPTRKIGNAASQPFITAPLSALAQKKKRGNFPRQFRTCRQCSTNAPHRSQPRPARFPTAPCQRSTLPWHNLRPLSPQRSPHRPTPRPNRAAKTSP